MKTRLLNVRRNSQIPTKVLALRRRISATVDCVSKGRILHVDPEACGNADRGRADRIAKRDEIFWMRAAAFDGRRHRYRRRT